MKLFILSMAFVAGATALQAETPLRTLLVPALVEENPVIVAARTTAGELEVESGLPIEATGHDEIVDIGSISKTVTAIAMLHLMEETGHTPQTPLADLLPDVPQDKAAITLHQLLTHTSGMVEAVGDDAEPLTREEFLGRAFAAPLEVAPGAQYIYSNTGYSILAAVIERQTGQRFEDYLIDHVIPEGLPPIGYARAFNQERSIKSNRILLTAFQRRDVARASWGRAEPGWNLVGNGGLVTSAEGFLSFWAAFLDGEIVSDAFVQAALMPHVDEGNGDTFYGYGLVVEELEDGSRMFWHDGGNDIFSAEWRHLETSGVTLFSAGTGEDAFDAMSRMLAGAQI